ncbi:MAG TPA: hypothetical protein VFZ49_06270 [Pyrinomonadaceae bacterium]
MRLTHIVVALLVFAAVGFGQMRPPEKETTPRDVKPAPPSFEAKYEGGIFGYSDKETGTLKFDDVNERLVFFGGDGKEKFGLPYDSLLMVYPDEKSVTSTTGNVVKYIPLPGAGLAGLIKEKRRYLVLSYDDPDVDAKGTTSFKLESKDLLESVIFSLGTKAKLKQRGDAFIKPRESRAETN